MAFKINGSKRHEPPTVRSLPSRSRMTHLAPLLALRILPSKFILTNPEGRDFQEIKITLQFAAEIALKFQDSKPFFFYK